LNSNYNLIIIDSNFILLPFQFKIDFLNEIRLKIEGYLKFIIFQQVLDELETKRSREMNATKFKRLFDAGLTYLKKNKENYNIQVIKEIKNENETTDEFLLRKAVELKSVNKQVFLATNDSHLRKKAKMVKIGRIFLRQKKKLFIERA